MERSRHLVGHSYGGMVITGVAEQVAARIASIVYVDAFLPGDAQSVADIVNLIAPGRMPALTSPAVPPPAASVFDVNEKDSAWVDSKLTAQPVATFTEKLRVSGAFLHVPRKLFVGVTKGEQPFFQAVADRYATDLAWQVHLVGCGHDVMIDKPDELATILEGAI